MYENYFLNILNLKVFSIIYVGTYDADLFCVEGWCESFRMNEAICRPMCWFSIKYQC